MIKRTMYIDRIRPFFDTPMIKVIVGVRRCGKSILLSQVAEEIEKASNKNNVVFVDLDDYSNKSLLNADALFEYARERIAPKKKNYLFFDEIQNVEGFERVVNSLHAMKDVSIFITGSNSKLLSGELASKLGGRTLSFLIMPFNFREYCAFQEEKRTSTGNQNEPLDKRALLADYLQWGGFPLVCDHNNDESRRVVLDNLYSSIVLRDIMSRNKKTSTAALESVLNYLIANSARTVSGNNIAEALTDSVQKISAPSVYDLIKSIEDAYIINRAQRYDLNSKKALAFESKEYVCDLGFFNIRKSHVSDEWGSIVETAVYNELLSRGMQVYVGKTNRGEIDFVVEHDGKRCYIQAAYMMNDESVLEREFGAYKVVRDGFPKYVVSMDPITISRDGITHLGLLDFLTDESLLMLS